MKFVFLYTKSKGERIAESFMDGARRLGHPCRITPSQATIEQNEILVSYGILYSTRHIFKRKSKRGKAIYLDNGWITTKAKPTLRWCWNGVQPFYADLPQTTHKPFLMAPAGRKQYNPREALLCYQSEEFFNHLGLDYTQREWAMKTKRRLEALGYFVTVRHKPTKARPEQEPLEDQFERVGIVVSLSSALTLKALDAGVPAYCTLQCSMSECAPAYLPNVGAAPPIVKDEVDQMISTLHGCDMTYEDLENGAGLLKMLAVPTAQRRGFWYGT